MDREAKERELRDLVSRVQVLEQELAGNRPAWVPHDYYAAYHALAGFVLGIFAAATSLLFNIVGSLLINQHPLKLIQIYLTFPLGEKAMEDQFMQMDNGLILAIGCCLYLATGMILGIPFNLFLTRWFGQSSFSVQLMAISLLSLLVWVVNYYAILSWLQPLLFGDNWIVREIPWYVGASTHLVFGWTILIAQPLGKFLPRPNMVTTT